MAIKLTFHWLPPHGMQKMDGTDGLGGKKSQARMSNEEKSRKASANLPVN